MSCRDAARFHFCWIMVCDAGNLCMVCVNRSRVDRQGGHEASGRSCGRFCSGGSGAGLRIGHRDRGPDTVSPGASTAASAGGTGGEACSYLPSSLQELFCPSAGGEGGETSGNTGGTAAGGTSGSGGSAAATGGTTGGTGATGTTPTSDTSGSSATPPGVVSNFLIWLAGAPTPTTESW